MDETCGKCGNKLGGFMGARAVHPNLLNKYKSKYPDIPDSLCEACFERIKQESIKKEAEKEKTAKEAHLSFPVSTLPIIPPGYSEIGIVTGHVALGTGVMSEFLSAFTDLVGAQSETYNNKIMEAEKACMWKLRQNAYDMGAGMIVGVHITYTELTSGKGMLMVCMSGTALKKD